ncbi:MAG: ATP-binding protein [Kiritimatiellae bacterium]|nr:ATP-binding protein [Kiritimatiellia bacterium]
MKKAIGKVSATENCPTTITSFTFWTKEDLKLSPFDIVKVGHLDESFTFGQIEEINHITDAASFMSTFISSDFGDTGIESPTLRVGLNYVKARVLGNSKGIYLPVHNDAPVFFAHREEIEKALGFDDVQNKVICGTTCMYANIDEQKIEIPVPLNRDFLIGPEGAHLNISGISGLASKTSYAMFLVKSLTEALASANNDPDTGTAAFIILNVKGKDLLSIDEMTEDADVEATKEKYAKLGLSPQPLRNVRYFYPYGGGGPGMGRKPSTYLPQAKIEEQFKRGVAQLFKFEAKSDVENIDLLFSNVDDPQQTMASIIDAIMISHETGNGDIQTRSWEDLVKSVKAQTDKDTKSGDKGILIQSWRRFYRFLNLHLNSSRAFADGINSENYECRLADEIVNISANDIFVVDVAKEPESMQAFVFGYVMREVLRLRNGEYDEQRENEQKIPDRIVIVVDEMNKYCSKDCSKDSPILKQILDITERGRSLGVVLFGAEQFRSAIHERVTGNCATKAYGRTNSVEVGKKDYGSLNPVQKDILLRMNQGEYIVENPVLRAPIRITFPKPIYKQYK